MRVLWLTLRTFSNKEDVITGGWLSSLAKGLIENCNIELANISTGNVKNLIRQDYGSIRQWIVPATTRINHNGLPLRKGLVSQIINVVNEFAPDLVHVWGTESFWGLLTARGLINRTSLLEIQGLKFAIAKVYHGGLSLSEQMACIGLKEIAKRSILFQKKSSLVKWGLLEKEIISKHRYIVTQTQWAESQVMAINSNCMIFHNDRMLRDAFLTSKPWISSGESIIFCSASYPAPFKGLHTAIRSLALLKRKGFLDIQLRIAGDLQHNGLRQDGYIRWLNNEIIKLGIEQNVLWLGAITAERIVDEMRKASVMLLPTFMENCSNAMQEAMMVGIPLVVSFTGGLPSLADDETSVLFFPPDDEYMCAYQLERILTNKDLAMNLSQEARKNARVRNNPLRIITNQMEIYHRVLDAAKVT
jgi:glycosyltransferase involved in cell wall biosynthesis